MSTQDLLLEIGCEEIPARFVEDGKNQLAQKVTDLLTAERISFESVESFATPRRLAVRVLGVAELQADQSEEVRGPAAKIAKAPDGTWSKAAQGFARKNGVELDQLEIREFKGDHYVFAVRQEKGLPTTEVLQDKLASLISSLPFPVTMRWGARKERFIRPVRWLVALFGEEVIPFEWAGVTADRTSQGHRFLGNAVLLNDPSEYQEKLLQESVMVDPEERKSLILKQIQELEQEQGWNVPIDEGLLEEVTYLVETPTVLTGTFEKEYLQVPKEVLITTMREHQRYFPVENLDGELLPFFLTVRNGDRHQLEVVAKGNEKVLRARLADAEFFYLEDQKQTIDQYLAKLDKIVYQEELGTVGDRLRRVANLAQHIGSQMDLAAEEQADLTRAATIAKFDLATQMIGEFPELEGYMGGIYASLAGEKESVAKAIEEHYFPHHAGDLLPEQRISLILSLADKVDQISSSFGIGIQPTGSQDPYGLRRKAAGVTQIYLESNYGLPSLESVLSLSIGELQSAGLLKKERDAVLSDLIDFVGLRFKAAVQEQIRYDVLDAILLSGLSNPALTKAKGEVLMQQLERSDFKGEVEGFTRVANLAKKANLTQANPELFQTDAEQKLYKAYQHAMNSYQSAMESSHPNQMYQALAGMTPEIHQFFDDVMVMVEEEQIRENRLALLAQITQLTNDFANFDQIVFPSE
ncbi:glycine--tRNA ligase subunit beta [Risungbinella massiliensis]|uniref:glycine--tRNA ligase subunit beta n=1 Tax=Risungbinella massiliensis TaxID=1329796 RepID=UPI0005CC10F0|nr:glycine--tRNA ligase subunit beta [Risungbinella massiliensis]